MAAPPSGTRARSPEDGSGAMFDRIAARYDLVNRVISLGLDHSWRRRTVQALRLAPGARVLDVATGTGDLAIEIARASTASVVGLDPSQGMLEIGRRKVAARQLTERVELVCGSAEALPFPDHSFDAACMAFGIRNVPDRPRALRELARVLRPSGRLAILELSEPRGMLGPLARFHVHSFVPWIGAMLSGAREYRYLERSIAAFPPAGEFVESMQEAGFSATSAHALSFGAVHLFEGMNR